MYNAGFASDLNRDGFPAVKTHFPAAVVFY
jgi:hypothetical protein